MVAFVFYFNPRFHAAFANPLFPFLFAGLISLKLPSVQPISTPLASLTATEALTIGQSFSICLQQRKTSDAGVTFFTSHFPAMQELVATNLLFATLLLAIGERQLMAAPWGMKFRVGLSAFISILDMVTDVVAIATFYKQGRPGFAAASIWMIATSMTLRVVVVYAQGHKRGAGRVCREIAIVLLALKPAVDAFRVVSGEEQHTDHMTNPFNEMILGKCAEM